MLYNFEKFQAEKPKGKRLIVLQKRARFNIYSGAAFYIGCSGIRQWLLLELIVWMQSWSLTRGNLVRKERSVSLGEKVLPHKKCDLELCFIRLKVIMKLLCLAVCGYTELQKSKFTPKVNLGRGVTQEASPPQGSETATQVDVDEVYMQDPEYLTRMINIYPKHHWFKPLFAFPMFLQLQNVSLKSVASPPKFSPRWHCQSHIGKQHKTSSKYLQLFQEELPALNDFRIDFHQAVSTGGWPQHCTADMSPVVVTKPPQWDSVCFVKHLKCLWKDLLQLHGSTSHLALDAKIPCNNTFQTPEGSHCALPRRKMEITAACLPQ